MGVYAVVIISIENFPGEISRQFQNVCCNSLPFLKFKNADGKVYCIVNGQEIVLQD